MTNPGTNVKRSQDRQAMSSLLRSVPKEMWQSLGRKKTVKEAWEAVRTMRVGADRVKEVNAQKLLKEFENIQFKDGEFVDDFICDGFCCAGRCLGQLGSWIV